MELWVIHSIRTKKWDLSSDEFVNPSTGHSVYKADGEDTIWFITDLDQTVTLHQGGLTPT